MWTFATGQHILSVNQNILFSLASLSLFHTLSLSLSLIQIKRKQHKLSQHDNFLFFVELNSSAHIIPVWLC
uniref:Uncharacterized protein n=1 Tax=Anguilla anguilla TaxID=7936 RepID=A0A0E9SJC7_ANGAN